MTDPSVLIQAGIDPKTGLPLKLVDMGATKRDIKRVIRIQDEQDAVNRYVWYNLPANISSQELERMLYYKGQLAFFYFKELDEFFFMPYTLSSRTELPLDFYGRYRYVTPVPMAEGTNDEEKRNIAKIRTLLSTKQLKVQYGIHWNKLTPEDLENFAVILYDYTPQQGQIIVPRQQLNDGIIDVEADCIPFMRTALKNSTGIEGIRTSNTDEDSNVYAANRSLDKAALDGDKFVPITGAIDFQELCGGEVAKSEEFMLAMQSLDNFRLGTYGIDNGGLFSRNQYTNKDEVSMNGVAKSPMQDGLTKRQDFCNIINSIYPFGTWCEIAEPMLGVDRDMDGESSTNDGEGTGNDIGGDDNGDPV